MKKLILHLLFLLTFCLLIPMNVVYGAGAPVVDQANLFSEKEKKEIEARVIEVRELTGIDIGVVTTDNAEGKTEVAYADDYYDYNGYEDNGVLLLIDMDNRKVYISTAGSMIKVFNKRKIESMLDDAFEYMPQQDYANAALSLLDGVASYAKKPGFSLLKTGIAVILGLLFGGGMFSFIASRYNLKSGTYKYPYREHGSLQLTNRSDILVNTHTTSRRIPRNNGGSGGGGSHTSSSGSSHGGGGRSF